jgi:quercetin dioxygenase-like cupin family protein
MFVFHDRYLSWHDVRMRKSGLMFALMAASTLVAEDVKFDTPQARVIESVTSPGERSPTHEHHTNRVLVYLDGGHEMVTDANGQVRDVRFHAGEVRWSPAGGPHTSDNVGGTTFRVVEVELKNGPGSLPASELDPVRVAPDHYKVEFENPQVRVLRAHYGPHEAGPPHEHILNRVMVYMTDAKVKVTGADGTVQMMDASAGDVRMGGAAKHKEENVSLLPFEVVVVELKR